MSVKEFYVLRNIEKQRIHLSSNGSFNDIYEGLPSMENPMKYNELREFNDAARISCMTEDKNNILMWSHYADKHSGICVEYDLSKLKEDPYKICEHLFPVVYCEKRIIKRELHDIVKDVKGINAAIEREKVYEGSEVLDDLIPLFLVKGKAWEYEREWRIIYTKRNIYDLYDTDLDNRLLSGNLEFPCMSGIYLGFRIDPEIREYIVETCDRICKSSNCDIDIYQAKIGGDGFDLIFSKLKS